MPEYEAKIKFACGSHSNNDANDILVRDLQASWEITMFEIIKVRKVKTQ